MMYSFLHLFDFSLLKEGRKGSGNMANERLLIVVLFLGLMVLLCGVGDATLGLDWNREGIRLNIGPEGSKDHIYVYQPDIIRLDGTYLMYYVGHDETHEEIYGASSNDGVNWARDPDIFGIEASRPLV